MIQIQNRSLAILYLITLLAVDASSAQKFKLPDLDTFVSDTLHIQVPIDSTLNPAPSRSLIQDHCTAPSWALARPRSTSISQWINI
jgi:hypothetical protein